MRAAVKQIAQIVAGVTGLGLLMEAMTYPGNGQWSVLLIVSGVVWAHLHAQDRVDTRAVAVQSAFGVSEEDLRSLLGLSTEQVTTLLHDRGARERLGAEMEARMRARADNSSPRVAE